MIYIGIDPDCKKSGVAIIEKIENTKMLTLLNLPFFTLYSELKILADKNIKHEIIIEAGFLNKSNWHFNNKFSTYKIAEIGERVGANHETAKKIIEMCEFIGLNHKVIKPLRSKIDSKMFEKITGVNRSNQEQRDAFMLIQKYY